MYTFLYRRLLKWIDPEQIHGLAMLFLKVSGSVAPIHYLMSRVLSPPLESMGIETLGLTFDHPLGVAGGFDKDACCLPGIDALGFSFVEVGTVTPLAQPGNPRKRLFRLYEDEAIINRMGFPNAGMVKIAHNLHAMRYFKKPICISLGKNKATDLSLAYEDYVKVLQALYEYGDFFIINISSPNTPELRKLQTRAYLGDLLHHVQQSLREQAGEDKPKPLLVKIAPDLEDRELDTLIDLSLQHQIGGIVATNTTLSREGLRGANRSEEGGLSGRPLHQRSTEIIRYVYRRTQGQIPIIGVGGIFDGDDVWEKMAAGATLVQAYTGFIYRGPCFVKKAITQLQQRMAAEGVRDIGEIVGSG
ncbi:MAG: quinone-dependent dihydroorotate dehydrogenase [Anaerolineae bacterium]|nr:quinone-dependent dihydroorotate dehydrogenase [Anaerolineae bacterium]